MNQKRTGGIELARRKKKKQSKKINIDTTIIILIVAGILSGVLIYFKSGSVGQLLSDFLGGVFGIVKYVIPIGILAVAINLIHDDKDYVISKLI